LYGIIAARAAHELKAFERRNAYLSSAQKPVAGRIHDAYAGGR